MSSSLLRRLRKMIHCRVRFSLLLLDPGEIYFEDFSAFLFSGPLLENDFETKKEIGRLKLCSKSIVFDPKDITSPIIKIPFKECAKISEWDDNHACTFLPHNNVVAVECRQYVEMLRDNKLAPYTFRAEKRTFLFLLNYAKLSDCLPQISQLHRASTLPRTEQSSMIAAIVYSRQSRVSFDTLWLGDLYEKVVLETQGNKITPLVLNPGRILLTSARLYFQPYNNVEPYPVLKICLQDIKRIEKRRFLLQHVGLEIYSENSNRRSHFYVTLKTSKQRDELYAGLIAQELVTLDDTDQHSMTLKWQNGILSNFDYLLYVNSLADRSFNDLTQYPVFPWVVADYTSEILDLRNPKTFRNLRKPVGALDESRLQRLKERYDEMSPPKFLYGSHYSTPGFVLFYLVRKFPQFMLCLQNGRFDHPDRMFNSISDVWNNVLRNMSDFKELVPEFYDPQDYGDLFVNGKGINFGSRHDGSKVANVALPPWAKGPLDFVTKLREALESDYVSTNLHHWIDLIFGYKQTGMEAEKADNLFYYLCYEGAIDLDSIADRSERHALEVQIMEFGQIPKQIFNLPHPQRRVGQQILDADTDSGSSGDGREISDKLLNEHIIWKDFGSLKKKTTFHSHKESVTSVAISSGNEFVVSVGQDSLLKIYSTSDCRQVRSVSLSNMPLSACLILADDRTLLVGSWDNNITLYNVEFGRAVDSMRSHDDAVSCLAWGRKSGVVASGSWDCSVRVWRGIADGRHLKVTSALAAELDHESHVSCIALNSEETLLLSGTQDGEIFIWSMDSHSLLQKMPGHSAKVNDASFSPDGKKLVTCGDDREFKVLDLSTGTLLYSKTLDQELRCLAWDGSTLLVGGSLGSLFVWDLVKVVILTVIHAHEGPISSIAVSQDGKMVVTGGEDRKVVVWETTEMEL